MLVATASEVIEDLAPFADIGERGPGLVSGHSDRVTLYRLGELTELRFSRSSGQVEEHFGAQIVVHASFNALLASDRYGALREWAANQLAFLGQGNYDPSTALDIKGLLNGDDKVTVEKVDAQLARPQPAGSSRVLLVDGPAGIGKTRYIESLARRRASAFVTGDRSPLILHVQSRGRTLTYIYDLIAYSLQRLRLRVTFDQIPVLARRGLITLAIDGFDELADPDGYGLAWSQVSDLIVSLRGRGSVILAGRETFIGRERIVREIAAIRHDVDQIDVLTLQAPTKTEALKWLRVNGWSEQDLADVEEFLEPSSMALRPFFLATLADESILESFKTATSTSVIAILMEAMINREVDKFGDAVDAELSVEERRQYVKMLMSEVARDMADNSSISISDATLSWLVEVALPKPVSETCRRILSHRSQAIAFLTNDDRSGYRRFYHDKFYEFFLSKVAIETVCAKEISKFMSRGILGSSFLETFADVISRGTVGDVPLKFVRQAEELLAEYHSGDRTRRNIAALLVSSLALEGLEKPLLIEDVELDEARFGETAGPAKFSNMTVSQLDVRGGDLSATEYADCVIITLIADADTIVSETFPRPTRIKDLSKTGYINGAEDVASWLEMRTLNRKLSEDVLISSELREHPALKLLFKACRLRQYWLRRSDDVFAARILDDPWWLIVEECLRNNNLLREEYRAASGDASRFIHIRKSDAILAEEASDDDVLRLFSQMNGIVSAS